MRAVGLTPISLMPMLLWSTSQDRAADRGGNISANPLLVFGDIHLSAGSSCIDAGTCTGAPPTDFEGDPRPSGAGCDIGADEFVP